MALRHYRPKSQAILKALGEGKPVSAKVLMEASGVSSLALLKTHITVIRRTFERLDKELRILTVYDSTDNVYQLVKVSKATINDV